MIGLALFISQQPRIFIHDTTDETLPDGGYHTRPHVMSRPGDVIAVRQEMMPVMQWALNHYDRIGLPVAREFFPQLSYRAAAEAHPGHTPDVFLLTGEANAVVQNPGMRAVIQEYEGKNGFLLLAERTGVPFPKTAFFDAGASVSEADLEDFTYPVFFKWDQGLAGSGVFCCNDWSDVQQHLTDALQKNYAYQVQQGCVDGHFINVSYYRDPETRTLHRRVISRQLLKGASHTGNIPILGLEAIYDMLEPLVQVLIGMVGDDEDGEGGLEGHFAVDAWIPELTPDAIPHLQVVEGNLRPNAASYADVTVERMNIDPGNWEADGFPVTRDFGEIDLTSVEFNPDIRFGVIILNAGAIIDENKIGLLLAGTPEQRLELRTKLAAIL